MSLWEHLGELRKRLLRAVAAVGAAFALAAWQSESLFHLLARPLGAHKLVFLSPTEGILAYFQVSAYAALVLASPVWLYQVWSFVAPALHRRERRLIVGLAATSSVLFAAGVATCWFLLPPMMGFLLTAATVAEPMLTIGNYLSFLLWFCLSFGIVFQLPIVVVFLVRIRLVTVGTLWRAHRYAILGCIVAAALVTPTTDPVNLALFALPLVGLFEVSLLVAWLLRPRPSAT